MTSLKGYEAMKLRLAALALFLTAGTASTASERRWTGVGWYVLTYGEVSEDKTGWLELTGGPYAAETACDVEAKRQDAADADYMILYSCKHLDRPPRPTSAGGIEIWIPANSR